MSTWQDLFAELRRLYGSVSELLLDSERLLDKAGFSIAHPKGRQIGISRSGAIDEPELWAPQWIARFFKHEGVASRKAPMLYVACILSDGGGTDYKLPGDGEPVLTAGILRHRSEVASEWDWRYRNAMSWLHAPRSGWPGLEWQEHRAEVLSRLGIERIECFGIPLESIVERVHLEQKAIGPLLERAGLRRASIEEDED
jgi:hypothetical protein